MKWDSLDELILDALAWAIVCLTVITFLFK
jgi:hypothetical protein